MVIYAPGADRTRADKRTSLNAAKKGSKTPKNLQAALKVTISRAVREVVRAAGDENNNPRGGIKGKKKARDAPHTEESLVNLKAALKDYNGVGVGGTLSLAKAAVAHNVSLNDVFRPAGGRRTL